MRAPRPLKRLYKRVRYGKGGKLAKHARKASARAAHFQAAFWRHGKLAQRRYASYEAYLAHQAEKLDRIYARRLEKDSRVALEEFRRRFRRCAALAGARNVLCLGARLGTEVRALQELGYFAVGIDINPGPHNAYVLHGDFHRLTVPDGSVDAVYCNALDHTWDLEQVIAEIGRVLRPGGVFIADVLPGYEEGFTPGEYESLHWRTVDDLIARVCATGMLRESGRTALGRLGKDEWLQVVLLAEPPTGAALG